MKSRHGAVSTALLTAAGVIGLGAAGLSVVTGVTPCSLVESCTTETAAPVAMTVCETKEAANEVTLVSAETKSDCSSKAVAVNASDCSSKTACEGEAKAVAVNASDCSSKTACEGEAKAVAVNDSDCSSKSSCEGEAQAVAVNASECATACEDEAKAVAVNASPECSSKSSCEGEATAVAVNASECSSKAACEDEAKAVAVNASSCETECSDDKNVTLVAGEGKGDCESSCAGEATAVAASGASCETECSDDKAATMVAGAGECCGECAEGSTKSALPVAVHAFNTECPYSGNAVKAGVYAKHNGMKVAFCCNGCKGRFDKADDAKRASLVANVVTPINTTCCDKPVDASTVSVINGFPVAQCSTKCSDYVAKAPAEKQAAFVASLIKPVNSDCCGTSAAEAKMVGFHNGKAVALCGEKCAEYFNKASAEKKDAWMAKMVSEKGMSCETECADAQKESCGDDCNADA